MGVFIGGNVVGNFEDFLNLDGENVLFNWLFDGYVILVEWFLFDIEFEDELNGYFMLE